MVDDLSTQPPLKLLVFLKPHLGAHFLKKNNYISYCFCVTDFDIYTSLAQPDCRIGTNLTFNSEPQDTDILCNRSSFSITHKLKPLYCSIMIDKNCT